jgi:flagellar motor switch protein FliN/FliY
MSQEPNDNQEKQPEDVDGLPAADAAEDAASQGGDIQALIDAAETAAKVPEASDADAAQDAAKQHEPDLTPAAEETPDRGANDASAAVAEAPTPQDAEAIQTILAATEAAKEDGAPGPANVGAAARGPADEHADSATAPFQAPVLDANAQAAQRSQLDLLDDVELDVKVELGRTEMYIEDVLGLTAGSVVELDKGAGDPVDILVNERLVARGEVLVLNDNFCVRINDILSPVPELEEL